MKTADPDKRTSVLLIIDSASHPRASHMSPCTKPASCKHAVMQPEPLRDGQSSVVDCELVASIVSGHREAVVKEERGIHLRRTSLHRTLGTERLRCFQ